MARDGIGRVVLVSFLIALSCSACASLPNIRILHDPLTAQEHLALGVSYESQGRLDLAISEYKAALKRGSEDVSVSPLIFLGNAYAQQGDFRLAEGYYRRALAKEPKNGEALNNLAWVYLQQGVKLSEAGSMVRRALDQEPKGDPNRIRYLDTLAGIEMAQGQYAQALDHLIEAEGLVTKDEVLLLPTLYLNQARAYEALGQHDQARLARQRAQTLLE